MNNRIKLRPLALAVLGTLAAASAFAQEGGYWYGGAGVGTARAKLDGSAISNQLLGGAAAGATIDTDRRSTAYRLFGGYQANRYFGVEAGYFDLGKYGLTTRAPAGTLDGRIDVQGFNADIVGTFPLTERLSALARLGVQNARTRDTFTASGGLPAVDPSRAKRATNAKAGFGLQYEFSPGFVMRGEAERYRVADAVGTHANVNVVSVSLVFPFGRSSAPAPRAMVMTPAPMAMAPAPAPAPAPVVVNTPPPAAVVVAEPPPAPAPRQRVSFSAESLFSFDQSAVQPAGRAALDGFAKEVDGTRFDSISVEGHTDRLGSDAYNQTLSQQRADAVKNYLVSTGRLDGAKISAVGRSESMPVTKPEDCKGNAANAKLVACLAPDRRVDVEVNGTR